MKIYVGLGVKKNDSENKDIKKMKSEIAKLTKELEIVKAENEALTKELETVKTEMAQKV